MRGFQTVHAVLTQNLSKIVSQSARAATPQTNKPLCYKADFNINVAYD
jgi:hypothetical protein